MNAGSSRTFLLADAAALESLLAKMTDEDVFMKTSLEERLAEVRGELEALEDQQEPVTASAELYFSGRPVWGKQGIESEFGAKAISLFQDIVDRVFAREQIGTLGQRGVVPGREQAKLFLTHLIHGSFGFRLEEIQGQKEFVDTRLKAAVDQASRLMSSFGDQSDDIFAKEVEELDERILGTVRNFFGLLRSSDAALRLVCGNIETNFDSITVNRATERAEFTTVNQEIISLHGQLQGALPDAMQFEFKTEDEQVLQGRIDGELEGSGAASLNRLWLDRWAIASLRVRTVTRGSRLLRKSYTLINIESS